MHLPSTLACAVFLTAVALGVSAQESQASFWSRIRLPAGGPARAIGSPGAGCIQGAGRLPVKGRGYRVAKPERGRLFGHPYLLEFVQTLSTKAAESGLAPIAIGDLGQARGGPAPSGHASHQNGLDVDVWFTAAAPGAEAQDIVGENTRTKHWTERVPKLLELAASDSRVDRIFVNPVIKRELCEHTEGSRGWLHKIRPWWGHKAHFHVRIACPADSPLCTAQSPLPEGDGCDDLEWWLGKRTEQDRSRGAADYGKRVGAAPELPQACVKLIE